MHLIEGAKVEKVEWRVALQILESEEPWQVEIMRDQKLGLAEKDGW